MEYCHFKRPSYNLSHFLLFLLKGFL